MKLSFFVLAFLFVFWPATTFAQNLKGELAPVTFEHLHINVTDRQETADWYVKNVGLEIFPSDNESVIYVGDKDHNFMLELSSLPNMRNTYFDIPIDAFHLAFEGHKTINNVAEKMLSAGATQEGELYQNKIGDYVMNVRDINGFTSQLIHRVNPFFSQPVNSTIRFEHFAFNVSDQKTSALWFVEFMNLTIPWSKDIDTTRNNFRNYRVPYVGDQANRMSFELFAKPIESLLLNMPHEVSHIAFSTSQPEEMAKRMVYGGATMVGTPKVESNGDFIIDLYDPTGVPIRLIKRVKSIL